jgi:hypothetical protein
MRDGIPVTLKLETDTPQLTPRQPYVIEERILVDSQRETGSQ